MIPELAPLVPIQGRPLQFHTDVRRPPSMLVATMIIGATTREQYVGGANSPPRGCPTVPSHMISTSVADDP